MNTELEVTRINSCLLTKGGSQNIFAFAALLTLLRWGYRIQNCSSVIQSSIACSKQKLFLQQWDAYLRWLAVHSATVYYHLTIFFFLFFPLWPLWHAVYVYVCVCVCVCEDGSETYWVLNCVLVSRGRNHSSLRHWAVPSLSLPRSVSLSLPLHQ